MNARRSFKIWLLVFVVCALPLGVVGIQVEAQETESLGGVVNLITRIENQDILDMNPEVIDRLLSLGYTSDQITELSQSIAANEESGSGDFQIQTYSNIPLNCSVDQLAHAYFDVTGAGNVYSKMNFSSGNPALFSDVCPDQWGCFYAVEGDPAPGVSVTDHTIEVAPPLFAHWGNCG